MIFALMQSKDIKSYIRTDDVGELTDPDINVLFEGDSKVYKFNVTGAINNKKIKLSKMSNTIGQEVKVIITNNGSDNLTVVVNDSSSPIKTYRKEEFTSGIRSDYVIESGKNLLITFTYTGPIAGGYEGFYELLGNYSWQP